MKTPETSAIMTDKGMERKRRLVTNYQYILASILVLGMAMIFTAQDAAANTEDDSAVTIETIYHVYYGNERIGVVDDKNLVYEYKDDLLNELQEKYNDLDLTIARKLSVIPERVFDDKAFNQETMDLLAEKLEVQASTFELKAGETVIGHISSKEGVDKLIRELKLQYVNEEELKAFEAKVEADEERQLEAGESEIVDIRLSEELKWAPAQAFPDDVLSAEQALKMIQQGTLEEELYTVQEGDVLGEIAANFDLDVEELLSLNPEITGDTLLQIGDELHVTVLRPLINVIVEKAVTEEETIPYQTETEEDSEMWKGSTEVTQEGKEGKKLVEYAVTYENGQTVDQETVSEEVITEPVTKVVVKGTKTSSSRGTGQLAWPAVGGYISSYQGTRWGRFHKGIDIARPSNHNILAADNGTVKSAGWENGYGNTIRINHNNGMETVYAHLESLDVSAGETVSQGQTIGQMGSTGNSTGIHLHFEVYQDGQLMDPMDYLNR
ncbi:Murein DD-endopeptidase MepM and murein hydrolase activator NlpD, contain LysM domain [Evansella caseinilytica]|uniref:Murein DD-endopeptidase MepM and murein hydrolase activator NlpD, contain LysM domain n=1 Tax=Evansella caseinilytica TaxID=1503961 RepID=A0A1H3UT52_9BACI|nr:M23 family metallopeptidase [Evansella caseinilytica]SDZ65416.1 Murein DD-endopeptidase MepM and murein hydrolase activator NlpD, contain LysM domain [Evansella caseinilytica]